MLFTERQLNDKINEVKIHLEDAGYERIGGGLFRIAFKRKNFVIKVPRSGMDIDTNVLELMIYSFAVKDIKKYLVPSKLLVINDIPCVMQPYAKKPRVRYYTDRKIKKFHYSGDGQYQTGIYKRKRRIFDYPDMCPTHGNSIYYGPNFCEECNFNADRELKANTIPGGYSQ